MDHSERPSRLGARLRIPRGHPRQDSLVAPIARPEIGVTFTIDGNIPRVITTFSPEYWYDGSGNRSRSCSRPLRMAEGRGS